MVEYGRVIACDGDAVHPFGQRFLRHKVRRYPEQTYAPLCVLHPLRRVGKKGEGRFAGISWDAALAEIAEVGRADARQS
jgi:anaerobic selenocysteine-containing dehydrogenase